MYPQERYEKIKKAVIETNFVSVKKLLEIMECSLTTLRRDINYLSQKGIIRKSRGGIQFRQNVEPYNTNFLYNERAKAFHREKEAISIVAQKFIKDRDIIILTAGTTTLQVARRIDEFKDVTVITNGIDIVNELKTNQELKYYS